MEITFSFGSGIDIPKTDRKGKGKSIIQFPKDYCVVDIETTGLSPEWDNIIELGAIKYSNGNIIGRFESLVQPADVTDGEYVDEFITELTGITNEMLAAAPKTADTISRFSDFIGNSIIIGYNVGFDVNFIYDNYMEHINRPLTNDYVDVMRMARKIYPDLPHHRLKDMINVFNLSNKHEHRTFSDCEATEQCYERLQEEAIKQFGTLDDFVHAFIHSGSGPCASDIVGDASKVNEDSPLYQQRCVFTGKLEKFTRAEAMKIVADLGGINEDGVTKNTNYLILGNNDYCKTIKQKKAEKNKLNGQDIQIVPETVFYDMIGEEF